MLTRNIENLRSIDYFREYSKYIAHLLANLNFHIIDKVAQMVIDTSEAGGTIYFAGNGGSAATASHYATDFSHGLVGGTGKLVKAVSLVDNVALITAIGNDYGYENVFTNQLKNLFREGDMLVVISASGNSPNVVKAVDLANEMGGKTVGISGFDGGKLKKKCDFTIHVETKKGEYGPVEDIHMILDHMLASYLILAINKKYEQA